MTGEPAEGGLPGQGLGPTPHKVSGDCSALRAEVPSDCKPCGAVPSPSHVDMQRWPQGLIFPSGHVALLSHQAAQAPS